MHARASTAKRIWASTKCSTKCRNYGARVNGPSRSILVEL